MTAWRRAGPGTDWDAVVQRHAGASLFQSAAWAAHRGEHGWQAERFVVDGDLAAAQVLLRRRLGVTLAWAPGAPLASGSVADAALAADLVRGLLTALRERYGRVYVRFDPTAPPGSALATGVARACCRPLVRLNSGLTVVVDLTADADALTARMSKHHRYELKRASASPLRWTAGRDAEHIEALVALHGTMTRRKRIPTAPQAERGALASLCRHFGDGAVVLIGWADGVPITACFALVFGDRAFFHTAATGPDGLRRAASYAAVRELALALARRGVTELDLGGLDPSARMAGVARFKEGFGGRLERRTGEWHWGSLPGLVLIADAALAVRRGALGA
ncbi:MAG: peptidoglycan bridge formation glycyltransferase FemA/FemB family protein [Chloroflexi bacterium]|nr:peptidoglycan bridge formation glycyltransferase FemA/FemB family protein [Chloroflexota bacterium]